MSIHPQQERQAAGQSIGGQFKERQASEREMEISHSEADGSFYFPPQISDADEANAFWNSVDIDDNTVFRFLDTYYQSRDKSVDDAVEKAYLSFRDERSLRAPYPFDGTDSEKIEWDRGAMAEWANVKDRKRTEIQRSDDISVCLPNIYPLMARGVIREAMKYDYSFTMSPSEKERLQAMRNDGLDLSRIGVENVTPREVVDALQLDNNGVIGSLNWVAASRERRESVELSKKSLAALDRLAQINSEGNEIAADAGSSLHAFRVDEIQRDIRDNGEY